MRLIQFLAIALISSLVITSSSLLLNGLQNRANATLPTASNNSTLIAQATGGGNSPTGGSPNYPTTPAPESLPNYPTLPGGVRPNGTPLGIRANQILQEADRRIFELEFRNANVNEAVQLFEEHQSKQFSKYFGVPLPARTPTVAEISKTLYTIYQQTGKKPALSYFVSLENELQLITVFPDSQVAAQQNGSAISLLKTGLNKVRDIFRKGKKGDISQNINNYVDRIILKKPRINIQAEVEKLQENITGDPDSQRQPYLVTAKALYNELIKPQESKLKSNKIETLIVAADSGLRSIPIAALYDESTQKHFVEKYSFALIPSFQLTNTLSNLNLQNSQLLAIGVSKSTQNQQTLPAASIEVDTLTQNFWKGKSLPLMNEDFTVQLLKQKTKAKHFDIVHLATHAEFKPGKADQSYIQMWNDKLFISKLKNFSKELQWNVADMVVLSACQTALEDTQAELGFAGLAVQTGVKTGIGSLWSIQDESSLALMMEFYSQLKKGLTKAEALNQAQLAMLQGKIKITQGQVQLSDQTLIPLPAEIANKPERNLKNPYYWSGVTVIGNWN